MGDYLEAKKQLEESIANDPTYPSPKENLGWVLANLGQVDKGLRLVEESLRLDGQNSYAFKNRAKIYLMNGEKELAIKDLKRATRNWIMNLVMGRR